MFVVQKTFLCLVASVENKLVAAKVDNFPPLRLIFPFLLRDSELKVKEREKSKNDYLFSLLYMYLLQSDLSRMFDFQTRIEPKLG